jgi:DNA-binding MarR family transcriptional regulator
LAVKTQGGFLISQIKQIQGRIFDKLLKAAEIDAFNGAQGRILFVLWQQDDLPITELSHRTGLAKTTLTSMLDRMEKQGHLYRKFDENNRRQVRVRLSEKAKSLSLRYEEVSMQMNELFYKEFSDEEIHLFESFLVRVLNNLKESESM